MCTHTRCFSDFPSKIKIKDRKEEKEIREEIVVSKAFVG